MQARVPEMTDSVATRRRASRLPLVTLLVALLMTATSGVIAIWWGAIDHRFIDAADEAGWNEHLLLPHQMGLTLAVDGVVLLSVVLSVISFVALLRTRRA